MKTKKKQLISFANLQRAFWNFLTILVLLGALCSIALYIFIYINPFSPFNPYPPVTPLPEISQPENTVNPSSTLSPDPSATLTPTPTLSPSIRVKTLTPLASPSVTSTPTATVTPSITPTPLTEVIVITPLPAGTDPNEMFFTPTATLRINFLYPYVLQSEPFSVAASSADPNKGCDWSGVAGKVFDLQGRPAVGLNIQMGGSMDDKIIHNIISLTGTATQHGPSGYEFQISDKTFDSYMKLFVQLVDQTGYPLSAKVYFNTFNDCSNNLVLIIFKQVRK
jgi:hypothetical protein